MRILSKSKLMDFRQCPKKLWLSIHRPALAEDADTAPRRIQVGYQVGEVARRLYDPAGNASLIDIETDGYDGAFARTQTLLRDDRPIFEGGFQASGAIAFADILLPVTSRKQRSWRMVEVKSAASVKDYHLEDAAIQTCIARSSGLALAGVSIAHIDSQWTYPGDGDYQGLLIERDVTDEVLPLHEEVRGWIADAHSLVKKRREPAIATGSHCNQPFACPFFEHCRKQEPHAEQPLSWLPGVRTKTLKSYIEEHPAGELRDVPDTFLNDLQKRVKTATLTGRPYFDQAGTAQALRGYRPPAYFMDFETIQFAVPLWKGTRPYQQIPFQFSVHRIGARGALSQEQFLDLSGDDPSKPFSEALISACGERGPVFVYNATFEKSRLTELADRFPRMKRQLLSIAGRVVDLHPIARAHFYHQRQEGSWSIKSVLPAACPDLSYDALEGVRDGGMAQEAFLEALSPGTPHARKAELERQLGAYCGLDTYALVRLWGFLSGKRALRINHEHLTTSRSLPIRGG